MEYSNDSWIVIGSWFWVVPPCLFFAVGSDYKAYEVDLDKTRKKAWVMFWRMLGVPLILVAGHLPLIFWIKIRTLKVTSEQLIQDRNNNYQEVIFLAIAGLIIYYSIVAIKTIKERRRYRRDGLIPPPPSDPYGDGTH